MDKREEIEDDLLEAVLQAWSGHEYAGLTRDMDAALEPARAAILQARSQAYEECATIAEKEYLLNRDGKVCIIDENAVVGRIAQAIRQHSQKGGENA